MPRTDTVHFYEAFLRLSWLRWQLKVQEQRLRKEMPALLGNIAPGWAEHLSTNDLYRITKYWQLALNLICGGLYRLRGLPLTEAEQQRIMLLSIFGPLYDDLFDEKILCYEQIEALTKSPEGYIPHNAKDELLKKIYLRLLDVAPYPEEMKGHLFRVFIWQKASMKQLDPHIGEEELYEITYNKCYHSILLFCAVLDHPLTAEMQKMLYPMAGLLQLTNDAFDVYKDMQSDIYTLPNLYPDYKRLLHHFMNEVALFNERLMNLPFPGREKKIYSITVHALNGMGHMSLEQLSIAGRYVSNAAGLKALSRKELVCDMDTFGQKIRWVKRVCALAGHRSVSDKHYYVPSQAVSQPLC
ncbi:class 1 isoprenoid biosynthesis enzyme [Compostibacter hankyongensis]|uniref:Terpene synthase n=1 Tax=Compostibacter hankyongensis TaxID=1007089 RepID=A0ABP8G1F1_9BACT